MRFSTSVALLQSPALTLAVEASARSDRKFDEIRPGKLWVEKINPDCSAQRTAQRGLAFCLLPFSVPVTFAELTSTR